MRTLKAIVFLMLVIVLSPIAAVGAAGRLLYSAMQVGAAGADELIRYLGR